MENYDSDTIENATLLNKLSPESCIKQTTPKEYSQKYIERIKYSDIEDSDNDDTNENAPLLSKLSPESRIKQAPRTKYSNIEDSDTDEYSPLLNKLSPKSQVPKEVSRKYLEKKNDTTVRNPYVVSQLSSSLNADSPAAIQNAAQYNRYLYYAKLHSLSGTHLVIPDHVLPRELFWPHRGGKGAKQSSIVTIFAIWNTMMGTSLLSMPWALQQSGFIVGIVLIVFMGLICFFTCLMIVKSANSMANKRSVEFIDICERHLGLPGKWICFVFGLIAFMGAIIVYWVLMTNFLYNVGTYIHDHVIDHTNFSTHNDIYGAYCPSKDPKMNHTGPPINPGGENSFYRYWNQRGTVPFFLLLLLVPLSSLKSPTFFTKFNSLGTISVLYIHIFVVVKAVQWGPHLQFSQPRTEGYVKAFSISFPALTGVLGLALYIHNGILSILTTNEKPENNARDVGVAYICTTTTYAFIGIIFYAFFPLDKSCIEQVLLDNFVASDVMTVIAQCGLLFQMTTVFPLLMYIIRVQVFAFLFNTTEIGYPSIIFHNCIIVSCGVLMAVFYPQVGHIIRYVGSACGMVYIFTLPPVIKMVLKYKEKQLSNIDIFLYSILILMGTVNFGAQFVVKD